MPYSQFTIDVIPSTFGYTISEKIGTFTNIPEVTYSELLSQILQEYIPIAIAIGTEKSRSEFIIAPILFEIKRQFSDRVSLFSGKEFNVEPDRGLSGFWTLLSVVQSNNYLFKHL